MEESRASSRSRNLKGERAQQINFFKMSFVEPHREKFTVYDMLRKRDRVKIEEGVINSVEAMRSVKLRTFLITHYAFAIIFNESTRQLYELMALNFTCSPLSETSGLAEEHHGENLQEYRRKMQRSAFIA